tara:strand:- start:1064 stop:1381 length:318 start_codon:yes stop_codon:yes gene_type:complete
MNDKEFLELYSSTLIQFNYYYGYQFYFKSVDVAKPFIVKIGGVGEDIYRFEINYKPFMLSKLELDVESIYEYWDWWWYESRMLPMTLQSCSYDDGINGFNFMGVE